jgi:integrase
MESELCPGTGKPCVHKVLVTQLLRQTELRLGGKGAFADPPLDTVVASLIAAKKAARKSARYVTSLRHYLTAFAKAHAGATIGSITAAHLVEWFAGRNECPNTMRSNLGRLSSLFHYAMRQRFIDHNPTKQIEPPQADLAPPETLTPRQAHTAARFVRRFLPRFCTVFALILFAGLRPSEARAIQRSDINTMRMTVMVRVSKVRRFRVAQIPACAVPYITTGDAPLNLTAYRRALRDLKRRTGFPIGQDTLRHTAATFWLALHQNASTVAFQMGNSSSTLAKHYNGLRGHDEARQFFMLDPLPPPHNQPDV